MRFAIQKLKISWSYFFRRCGYLEIQNQYKNNEISYVRSLNAGRNYPRFHIYLENGQSQSQLNIHLDAKEPSYQGTSAHSGEYEGELVEKETTRIQSFSEEFLIRKQTEKIGFSKKSLLEKFLDLFS